MEKQPYITFKIRLQTAEEFRNYSRQLGKQQSETLQLMLDFFKVNRLSPLEELGPNFITLEKRIKDRINALVAILKDIEKTQTKPTHSMLQLLFQESPITKKEILREKNQQDLSNDNSLHFELLAAKSMEKDLRKKLTEKTEDLKQILDRVAVVRNSFGRPYLRLNLTKEEFEQLKSRT
ncbi:hypothetical protein GCM10007103_13090 [Salinimicrobium marinum]|uniref:Uncharacterized protein n=1 Tax=Salinimicrobium marinum TaxID=680283 RepID=A0A918SAN0_9FLAO|nr:BfmA/BtgA family mobilization protein [Salinimicrobium marinum]GHA33023.1 hypothetical protein GCM10007103_13090 [Salinimicrobium marinum]